MTTIPIHHDPIPARAARPPREVQTYTLDGLAAMSCAALERLYVASKPPATLEEVSGAPRGRMLSVRHLERSPLAGPLRRFAASFGFPWDGKSFFGGAGGLGTGINRVHLGGGGRHKLFGFSTHYGASCIDGEPCVVLDYDDPDNPGFIRSIHDEIREVSPGVYLGPAMWKTDKGPALVLWFALSAHEAKP